MAGLTEPNQVGKREDLADIYSIVDMKTTPFCTQVQKSSKPTNSEFDWLVDSYANVKTTGTVDGSDVADFENHAENRARLGNYVQVFRRTAKVSRLSQDLSNVAGVKSEIALATAKKLVEIKRDQEATFLSSNAAQADTGAVEYKTAGLGLWIDTTGPTVPRTVPAAYRTPTAQIITTATASLAEDTDVQGILTAIYNGTGMNGDYVLYAGSVLRRRFTDMTRTVANANNTASKVRVFNYDGSSKSVANTVTVYEGDYGSIRIESSSYIGVTVSGATVTVDTDRGYLLDMDKIHLRTLSKPSVERFEDQGGGPRILVEAVAGLQVDNPIGLGKFQP